MLVFHVLTRGTGTGGLSDFQSLLSTFLIVLGVRVWAEVEYTYRLTLAVILVHRNGSHQCFC